MIGKFVEVVTPSGGTLLLYPTVAEEHGLVDGQRLLNDIEVAKVCEANVVYGLQKLAQDRALAEMAQWDADLL